MFEYENVLSNVESRLRKFIGDIAFRSSDETLLLYVPREKVADKATAEKTSVRQMNNLAKKLADIFSVDIDIIYTIDDDHYQLESSFHEILKRKFPDKIFSLYMSLQRKTTIVSWIEVGNVDEEEKLEIESYYADLLKKTDYEMGPIDWIDTDLDLPSLTWILRQIKINQPVKIESLQELMRNSYPSVSIKWLNKKLDQIRRKELLIRNKEGFYSLTYSGLNTVPAGVQYHSSDVLRALAFGRKKW